MNFDTVRLLIAAAVVAYSARSTIGTTFYVGIPSNDAFNRATVVALALALALLQLHITLLSATTIASLLTTPMYRY